MSWPEALDGAATAISEARDLHGPGAIAVLGGARGTNEDAYTWARLAKGVIGTDHVDAQLGDGLPAEVVLGVHHAEIADCDRAAAIVLLGPDLKEELPVLVPPHPAGRCASWASRSSTSRPSAHGLSQYATATVRPLPGEAIGADAIATTSRRVRHGRTGPVVVVLGRGFGRRVGRRDRASAAATRRAARRAVPLRRCGAATCTARSAPASRPGSCRAASRSMTAASGSPSAGARRRPTAGSTPRASSAPPPTARSMCSSCSAPIPLADFPDAGLATRALDGAGFVIAVDAFVSDSRAARRRVPARARCGARRRARSPTSKAASSASAARSRPKAPRWTTGASRPSSRSASAPTSTSRPSTRSPTRSPCRARASRARRRAAAPRARRRRAAGARAPRRARAADRRPDDPGRGRPGHVVGSDQDRGRGAGGSDRSRRRRRAGSGDEAAPAPEPRCPSYEWDRADLRRQHPAPATRTLCGSWSAARSTTVGGSSPRRRSLATLAPDPRAARQPARPRAARCRDGTEVQLTSARGTLTRP